jgi:hypothetical protein
MRRTLNKIFLFLLVVSIVGCKSENRFERTVIEVEVQKQILVTENFTNLILSELSFEEKYNQFARIDTFLAEVYFSQILGLGKIDSDAFKSNYRMMLEDPATAETIALINATFEDFSLIENELNSSFLKFQKAFPEAKIPVVIFAFTGLNYSVAAFEDFLLVGLEFYLGKDFEGYRALGFPEYIIERRKPEYLITEIIKGWLMSEFPKNPERYTLLDEMVYQGMILFSLASLCTEASDNIIIGYSDEQLKYTQQNEANIWGYFINNKLLFSESRLDISKYTDEAPFSAGMTAETPGRVGVYIGWRIVESYMKKYPEKSLNDLMQETDYKKIFTSSKYKPTK